MEVKATRRPDSHHVSLSCKCCPHIKAKDAWVHHMQKLQEESTGSCVGETAYVDLRPQLVSVLYDRFTKSSLASN